MARGLPTAVTLAAQDEALAGALVQALGSPTFRPYHTHDVRGVEIGGAAKNVLAIAAGIVVGRQFGASAQAALTTRGFSELARLGRACGARGETMAGLSGLGDLILTCSSPQSRNFALGMALGRGERPPRDKLAEGEFTAPVLIELAASQHIDMPVSQAVAAILSGADHDRRSDRKPADAPVQGGGIEPKTPSPRHFARELSIAVTNLTRSPRPEADAVRNHAQFLNRHRSARLTQKVGYPNHRAPAASQPAKAAKAISSFFNLKASTPI